MRVPSTQLTAVTGRKRFTAAGPATPRVFQLKHGTPFAIRRMSLSDDTRGVPDRGVKDAGRCWPEPAQPAVASDSPMSNTAARMRVISSLYAAATADVTRPRRYPRRDVR